MYPLICIVLLDNTGWWNNIKYRFFKSQYKNENSEIYTVYRKSAKKYQDMNFGQCRTAMQWRSHFSKPLTELNSHILQNICCTFKVDRHKCHYVLMLWKQSQMFKNKCKQMWGQRCLCILPLSPASLIPSNRGKQMLLLWCKNTVVWK